MEDRCEDEIASITAQLDQLDYELDSRIDSLHTQVNGRIDVVADHVTHLDGLLNSTRRHHHERSAYN